MSHSQSILSYRHIFYLTCIPCHFQLCFSRLFLSLVLRISNLCSFCSAGSKARFNFPLPVLFCSIFSLSMMEKNASYGNFRILQNLAYPRLVEISPTTRSFFKSNPKKTSMHSWVMNTHHTHICRNKYIYIHITIYIFIYMKITQACAAI